MQESHVPVFVKPMNDPPIIHVPKFITLVGNEASDDFQLFKKQRDIFEFSISDSDIFHYSGTLLCFERYKPHCASKVLIIYHFAHYKFCELAMIDDKIV